MRAATDALATVSRLARPLTEDELYTALQPMVILWGQPDFGEDAEGERLQVAWFDLYYAALKTHPKEAIDIAVSECIRTHRYNKFPLPADIHRLAGETTAEIKLIEFRLKKAVMRAEEHRPAPKKQPGDRETVTNMLQEMRGPDGRLHLASTKSTASVTPATNRNATADALRRLARYR